MLSNELATACKYFINTLNPDHLKLQQLLYFTQGVSFCMYDEEFFSEQIEALEHGYVISALKHMHNSIECCEITVISERQQSVL